MDLADIISRGAMTALDLAPDDRRLAELSRQVLHGGASRFARVVTPGERIDLVVPVGIPEATVSFGALTMQPSRVGLVWRDAAGVERTASVALGDTTRSSSTPVALGHEQWTRFDVTDGRTACAFLLPPTDPRLRSALAGRLTAHAGQGKDAAAPVAPPGIPAPVAQPAAPVTQTSGPVAATASTPPAPAAATASTPTAWQPAGEPLYRESPRTPVAPRTAVMPSAPGTPAQAGPATDHLVYRTPVTATATLPAVADARPGTSATTIGFWIGLVATLVIGGIALALLLG